MLKRSKRFLSCLVAAAVVQSGMGSAFAASIKWSERDLPANTVYESTFDGESGAPAIGGEFDTEKFSSDAAHKTVVKVSSSAGGRVGTLPQDILAKKKIKVKFDYYSESGDALRVEIRDFVRFSNGDFIPAAKYWTGSQTGETIAKNQWNTYEGTIDLESFYNDCHADTSKTDITDGTNPYLFIKASNSGVIYVDNMSITAINTVPLPLMKPEVTYNSQYAQKTTADGHTDAYKCTVDITGGNASYKMFETLMPGYYCDGETYEVTFSYKMDGATNFLRTLQWKNTSGTVVNTWDGYKGSSVENWWPDKTAGEWHTVTNRITLNSTDEKEKPVLDNGYFAYYLNSAEDCAAGTYVLYLADVSIKRVPAIDTESNAVEFDDAATVKKGGSLTVDVSGYFDSAAAPKLVINNETVTGAWQDVTSSADGMSSGKAVFADVTSEKFTEEEYNTSLVITDIWDSEETNPLKVEFVKEQTVRLEVLKGDWKDLGLNAADTTATANGWVNDKNGAGIWYPMAEYFNSGKTLVKLSFDAAGKKGVEYTNGGELAFRTGSGTECSIKVPAEDLNDGNVHSYSRIVDIGGLDRYYTSGSEVVDRANTKWALRAYTSNDAVSYTNIKVEYFDPDSTEKTYSVSRLKITNNDTEKFAPNGVLILAKYSGKQCDNVKLRNVKYDAANALAENETKYIYIVPNENQLMAADSSCKAFYWNSLSDMIPIAEAAAK